MPTENKSYFHKCQFFPAGIPREKFKNIVRSIRKQRAFERSLNFSQEEWVNIDENRDFILDSKAAREAAHYVVDFLKYYFENRNQVLDVLDLGGGTGGFSKAGFRIRGTLATLVDYFARKGEPVPSDTKLAITSAELPPEEFYRAFHVVASINGPLQWSSYPEIVSENIVNMIRAEGIAFLHDGLNICNPNFILSRGLRSSRIVDKIPIIAGKDENQDSVNYIFLKLA